MNKIYFCYLLFMLPLFGIAQISTTTGITLNFTASDAPTVTATATLSGNTLVADGPINLLESTDYALSISLSNGNTDLTSLVTMNGDNLQFFFVPSEGLFEGDFTYNDNDGNNLPIGLSTNWTGSCVAETALAGTFRVALNDLTGIKSGNSTINDGTTILDVTWDINITNDVAAPECENEEEVIDKVTLTFTPEGGGSPVVAIATDPDGPGPQDLQVEDINLIESTTYELAITAENTIEGEDITEEIEEEDEEHQFYFAWTGDIFTDPTGDGNIDNSNDPVNYNDQDENGLPVGLSTTWTTNVNMSAGTFRVALKHQPDIKSNTSTFEDGGTDLDITWNVNTVITSLDNLSADQKLIIAPNPVREKLILVTENLDLSSTNGRIYNAFGKLVKTLPQSINNVDVSDLPSGTYVLHLLGNDLRATRRFVKN